MSGPTLAGRLLVATPGLRDPNFVRTVVFLLESAADGAVGVVLNRPSTVPVDAVLPGWAAAVTGHGVLHQGGPVGLEGALGVEHPALGLGEGRVRIDDGGLAAQVVDRIRMQGAADVFVGGFEDGFDPDQFRPEGGIAARELGQSGLDLLQLDDGGVLVPLQAEDGFLRLGNRQGVFGPGDGLFKSPARLVNRLTKKHVGRGIGGLGGDVRGSSHADRSKAERSGSGSAGVNSLGSGLGGSGGTIGDGHSAIEPFRGA